MKKKNKTLLRKTLIAIGISGLAILLLALTIALIDNNLL